MWNLEPLGTKEEGDGKNARTEKYTRMAHTPPLSHWEKMRKDARCISDVSLEHSHLGCSLCCQFPLQVINNTWVHSWAFTNLVLTWMSGRTHWWMSLELDVTPESFFFFFFLLVLCICCPNGCSADTGNRNQTTVAKSNSLRGFALWNSMRFRG